MSKTTEALRGRGRPSALVPGSVPYRISELQVGEAFVELEQHAHTRRYLCTCAENVPGAAFEVTLCYGLAHGFEEAPFRLFRVTRTA
ncbi:hypothetical protein AB4Y45_25280 [Paraburkholderia sp. EG287A]|uniref:hypothetical protein n=1 Tax=unclassified Paraburkholderia TaxID=2615204 RepID=UPI0034D155B5